MTWTTQRTANPASTATPSTHAAAVNPLERQLLVALNRPDAVPITAIPTRWPLTRMHVPQAVHRLVAAGLVKGVPSVEKGGAVTLTERGLRALRSP
jgi:hypothetical protein